MGSLAPFQRPFLIHGFKDFFLAQEAPQERDNFSIAIQVEEEYRTRFHGKMNIHFLLHRVDVVRRREM